MPRFLTISPTHIPGKKKYAWEKCKDGGYVAIGWMDVDLSRMSIDEVEELIRSHEFDNQASAIESFGKFLTLDVDDYVAVNNASHGLFGVGRITSGYRFVKNHHDTGADNVECWYSHLRDVSWEFDRYVKREDIVSGDETSWAPYGTVGALREELPPYIERLLGIAVPTDEAIDKQFVIPEFLQHVIERIGRCVRFCV